MSKIIRCKKCGAIIQNRKTSFCPACGAKIKRNHTGTIIILVVLLFICYRISIVDSTTGESSSSKTAQQREEPSYSGEITFQNYEWGASANAVSVLLQEQFFESVTPTWSDADDLVPTPMYSVGFRIFDYGDNKIAGYDVANFSMYFHYGEHEGKLNPNPEYSKLYLVTMNFNVADIEGTYNDLLQKLTSLYGEGKTTTSRGSAYSLSDGGYKHTTTTTEWRGQNNSGIKLSMCLPSDNAPDSADMFHHYLVLSYGKTDSDSTISKVYKDYQAFVAEQEKSSRDSSNKDGL